MGSSSDVKNSGCVIRLGEGRFSRAPGALIAYFLSISAFLIARWNSWPVRFDGYHGRDKKSGYALIIGPVRGVKHSVMLN